MIARIPLVLDPQPEGRVHSYFAAAAGTDNRGRHHFGVPSQRGGRLCGGIGDLRGRGASPAAGYPRG